MNKEEAYGPGMEGATDAAKRFTSNDDEMSDDEKTLMVTGIIMGSVFIRLAPEGGTIRPIIKDGNYTNKLRLTSGILGNYVITVEKENLP